MNDGITNTNRERVPTLHYILRLNEITQLAVLNNLISIVV